MDWQAELRRTGILLLRDPDNAQAQFERGVAAHNLGDWSLAAACLERARQLAGDQPVILRNLIRALLMACEVETALDRSRLLVDLVPDDPENLALLGMALLSDCRTEAALAVMRRCTTLADPAAPCHLPNRYNMAVALLTLGQWREAWALYEARWRFADAASLQMQNRLSALPVWRPDLPERADLVVGAEQGNGDMIMIARFLPELARGTRSLTVAVPDRLQPLLAASFDSVANLRVVKSADLRVANHSHHLMAMSIPGVLSVEPALVRSAPYLSVPAGAGRTVQRSGRLAVGISWLGSPTHAENSRRSVPSPQMAEFMARFPEVDFHAVAPASQVPAYGMPANLHRSLGDADGFDRSAALVADMDLVLSVDSAAAHLAGALGVPVWTLLHWRSDWRWGRGADDRTCWYDSMHLLRQARRDDWAGPLDMAAGMLRARLNRHA